MKLLILGGTGFIGPHTVRYAIERGHKVSVFNRGTVSTDGVENLRGNREGDLDALGGRVWDAVIDIPARVPAWVRDVAQVVETSQYLFISTISVYADSSEPDADESALLLDDDTYGGLKARAEAEAEKGFPGKTTIVRPGLVAGPGDPTDRFTYWPLRIARGGEVLAPGDPSDPVQLIDVRDLAEWTIHLVEQRILGTFNAVGPASPLSIGEMLEDIRAVTSSDARFTWAPFEFLERHGVAPWSDMPVWIPPVPSRAGFGRRSNRRAIESGLTFRPLADTIRATLAANAKQQLSAGITSEREAELLAAKMRE